MHELLESISPMQYPLSKIFRNNLVCVVLYLLLSRKNVLVLNLQGYFEISTFLYPIFLYLVCINAATEQAVLGYFSSARLLMHTSLVLFYNFWLVCQHYVNS